MNIRPPLVGTLIALCAMVSACAGRPAIKATQAELTAPEADRAAIRAMAGEYRVEFSFQETVALTAGYTLTPPKKSGATEWIIVIEDTPEKISLQHILVMGDTHHVVKHWRQDWRWQPRQTWHFTGNRSWVSEQLDDGRRLGHWEQSVWEVDDEPRYFGLGRWLHENGNSSWTSQPTSRPLPRREYSIRNDYDILVATNRQVITPLGWVHEQDNSKIVTRHGTRTTLAREIGVNTYTRLPAGEYDFTAGRDYWQRTADLWARVRAEWARRMADQLVFSVQQHADGDSAAPLSYQLLFDLAARTTPVADDEIAAAIDRIIVDRDRQPR